MRKLLFGTAAATALAGAGIAVFDAVAAQFAWTALRWTDLSMGALAVPLAPTLLATAALRAVTAALLVQPSVPTQSIETATSRPYGTDREFLPAALEILETPPSPIALRFLLLLCAAIATGLTWGWFAKLDIHVVAQGKVQPDGRSKVVQPSDAGQVTEIAVRNGDRVAADALLVALDATQSRADADAQTRELFALEAELARRRVAAKLAREGTAELSPIPFPADVPPQLQQRETEVLAADFGRLTAQQAMSAAEIDEKTAQRQRIDVSLASRADLLVVLKERVDMREALDKQKFGSRASVIDALQEHRRELTTDAVERGQIAEIDASIASLRQRMAQARQEFIAGNTEKAADAERRRDALQQELIKARDRNARTRLYAPIAGTVQQVSVTTIGQVVAAGQSLMTIVPSDAPIEVEAMIQNQDIGFVEAGQHVVVKVDAFPFTRFGSVDGTIVKVSRDAVAIGEADAARDPTAAAQSASMSTLAGAAMTQGLVFPATISLSRTTLNVDGKLLPLSAGMSVAVEIKTGERRALDYVLSPLREIASQTAHER